MKNNKGFGKFEVLTVFVLVIAIFAFLMHSVLGGATGQKISTMKDSAISFSKIVFLRFRNVVTGDVRKRRLPLVVRFDVI